MPLFMTKKGTITLDEVKVAVRSKLFLKMKDLKIIESGKGLNVSKWGSERIKMSKSKRFDESRLKCFTFQKSITS